MRTFGANHNMCFMSVCSDLTQQGVKKLVGKKCGLLKYYNWLYTVCLSVAIADCVNEYRPNLKTDNNH